MAIIEGKETTNNTIMMMVDDTTLSLAVALGTMFTVIGLALLMDPKRWAKVVMDFWKDEAVLYIGSLMALFFGIVILLLHNEWTNDWTVIITIFGWLGLIKGIMLLWFPNNMKNWTKSMFKKKDNGWLTIAAVVYTGLGLFLLYKGYPVLY